MKLYFVNIHNITQYGDLKMTLSSPHHTLQKDDFIFFGLLMMFGNADNQYFVEFIH